jgi:hypothetical protein
LFRGEPIHAFRLHTDSSHSELLMRTLSTPSLLTIGSLIASPAVLFALEIAFVVVARLYRCTIKDQTNKTEDNDTDKYSSRNEVGKIRPVRITPSR